MTHSDCPSPQQLIDFCIGKLADEEINVVASHLDNCGSCLETVEALEKMPIPFVGYHLSVPESNRQILTLDLQFQHLLVALKRLKNDSDTSQG